MPFQPLSQTGAITETIRGIVDRVTYHNPDNGWSVLRGTPVNNPHQQETVIVHQTKVFAGATMEFHGAWTVHPKFGRQFKAVKTVERKPATTAALEKYLGSGLIKGVGPKPPRKLSNILAARRWMCLKEISAGSPRCGESLKKAGHDQRCLD